MLKEEIFNEQQSTKQILSVVMTAAMLLTMLPGVPVLTAQAAGGALGEGGNCDHIHGADCSYAEAASCFHDHDEDCGWDEDAGFGCTHQHGELCGYVEAAPCDHLHDETCGGLPPAGSGEPDTNPKPPDRTGQAEPNIAFTIPEDGDGSTALYLTEGVAVTEADLLLGVSAEDENGEPVPVAVSGLDGLDLQNPQMRGAYPNPPYVITYAAEHPVTGEPFTAQRDVYVTIGSIMPLALPGAIDLSTASGLIFIDTSTQEVTINGVSFGTYGTGEEITITGTWSGAINADESVILVWGGAAVNITLSGVDIDVSGTSDACAFEITGNSTVSLTLDGTNTLKSGDKKAGLQMEGGNALTITGTNTDSLNTTGGYEGAGIGGGVIGDGGSVTIGGGQYARSGSVTISGGTVNATGGQNGAGIGGGGRGAGFEDVDGGPGTAQITGGDVTVLGHAPGNDAVFTDGLGATLYWVTFIIKDGGVPVDGAQVSAGNGTYTATTNASGYGTLFLPGGSYMVTLSVPGKEAVSHKPDRVKTDGKFHLPNPKHA